MEHRQGVAPTRVGLARHTSASRRGGHRRDGLGRHRNRSAQVGAADRAQKETAEALRTASAAFKINAYPLVRYERIQWTSTTAEKVSCEQPPTQMFAYLRNYSGVPIAIKKRAFQLYIDNKPVLDHARSIPIGFGLEQETILPAGHAEAVVAIANQNSLPAFFQSLHGPDAKRTAPRMTIEVHYRSLLVFDRESIYRAELMLLMDCRTPGDQRVALNETNVEVAVPPPVVGRAN